MNQSDLGMAIKMVDMGMSVLRVRLITFCCLLLTFGLFAWCAYEPELYRIVSASLFALFSLQLIRMSDKEPSHEASTS